MDVIKSTLLYIVNSPILFFGTFFLFRALLWGVIEHFWSARPVAYRKVGARDFGAQLFHVFLIVPFAIYLYDRVFADYPQLEIFQDLPIALRIVLYLLLGDLGYYWMHRLMHIEVLWPVHKWHHSPTYMYWLAGCRSTITHQFLVGAPFVLASPVLNPAPWWIYTGLAMFSYLNVDWMHLNTPWGNRRLEWVFVTPRYHHIHHSANSAHYDKNLGNLVTFWDRLFGTYLDPEKLMEEEKELSFGLGESPNPVRLIVGF